MLLLMVARIHAATNNARHFSTGPERAMMIELYTSEGCSTSGSLSRMRFPDRERQGLSGSGEDAVDDSTCNAGEAEVEALEFDGEAFVVDTELVEDGGLEVVDFDDVFDGVVAEFVG